MRTSYSRRNRIIGSIVSLFIITLSAWIFFNSQYIYDLYSFWNYNLSSAVADISTRADLTKAGQFYLYASDTTIEDASNFNTSCKQQESGNAILGCYSNNKIYIYNVNNSELDGIKEVTAAHEMFHAVWQRQSDSEKTRISTLLQAAYDKNVTPELKTRMDYYNRNEKGQFYNELHSILGTEIPNLGPELEAYYSKYFIDRTKIVGLYANYNKVFEGLATKSKALYDELTSLGQTIDSMESSYNKEVATLNANIITFNNKADNGGFSTTAEFNSERNKLVVRINNVQSEEKDISTRVNTYNQKYKDYQALIVRSQTITRSIDSTLSPVPSL